MPDHDHQHPVRGACWLRLANTACRDGQGGVDRACRRVGPGGRVLHARGPEHLAERLPATLDAVQVPVVAAGGVATAERFAELMQLGADAVRVGTRFVVCTESTAHPQYVDALLRAQGEADTVVTEWFGEGWEHAPHRVLRSALEAAQRSGWRKVPPPERTLHRDVGDMDMSARAGLGPA